MLQETDPLGTKPVATPIEQNPQFWSEDGDSLENRTKYWRLIRKLI